MEKIIEKIMEGRKILITTHVSPDGDGIGSGLALFLALNKINTDREKIVRFAIDDAVPKFLKFLPHAEMIEHISHIHESEKFDTVISVDCANFERLGKSGTFVKEGTMFLNIDHHISNEGFGNYSYIDDKASSVAEIMYGFIKKMDIEIDTDIASAIYCGIINDTGNFAYNNVSAETFTIAADLRGKGIDIEMINQELFHTKSIERMKIQAYAIENMIFLEDLKLIYVFIPKDVLDKNNATKEDTEGLVESLRSYEKCEVSLLLREDKKGHMIKGSFRSKAKDVNRLAALFGGGGHIKAAGFSTGETFNQIIEKIIANWN